MDVEIQLRASADEVRQATASIEHYFGRSAANDDQMERFIRIMPAEPRRLGFSLRDGIWVRLLDVKAALSERSYQDRGSVVVEVPDTFCPWNVGRWRIGVDGISRTDDTGDLRCDVSALGSVYLGGFTWMQLSRALRVAEIATGAAAHAYAIFQTTSAPWCREIF